MAAAIPLFGAFVLGLGARRWLLRHISLLFRMQLAGGIGLLSVLAGWSFDVSVRNVAAIGVLLVAQLTAVSVAARLFRGRTDGPLLSFWMFGNPTFWTAPVAAATLGAEAAVFVIAYDMLTQARIAVGVQATCAAHAPKSQSARTALADYAPTIGAVTGLVAGQRVRRARRRRHGRRRARHRRWRRRLPAARRVLAGKRWIGRAAGLR